MAHWRTQKNCFLKFIAINSPLVITRNFLKKCLNLQILKFPMVIEGLTCDVEHVTKSKCNSNLKLWLFIKIKKFCVPLCTRKAIDDSDRPLPSLLCNSITSTVNPERCLAGGCYAALPWLEETSGPRTFDTSSGFHSCWWQRVRGTNQSWLALITWLKGPLPRQGHTVLFLIYLLFLYTVHLLQGSAGNKSDKWEWMSVNDFYSSVQGESGPVGRTGPPGSVGPQVNTECSL